MEQSLRVLIIEHDRSNRELAQAILCLHGHEVTWCRGAGDAVRCLTEETHGFDVVLLDLEFPEQGGLEIAAELRRHPATRAVPILCTLTLKDGRDRALAMLAGCREVLPKPYRCAQLIQALESVMALGAELRSCSPG